MQQADNISENLLSLQDQIKSACQSVGRDPASVLLVAVSKKQPIHRLEELAKVHGHFAENYVQSLQERQRYFPHLKWHFIGKVQSNKLKFLIGNVELIHTIDHLTILEKADRLARSKKVIQDILLQVNLSREASKQGFFVEDMKEAFAFLAGSQHLKCKGLMTLPPFTKEAISSKTYFRELKALLESSKTQFALGDDFKELSMGTSQDFVVAIEEGATMIRLGESLFGPRLQ